MRYRPKNFAEVNPDKIPFHPDDAIENGAQVYVDCRRIAAAGISVLIGEVRSLRISAVDEDEAIKVGDFVYMVVFPFWDEAVAFKPSEVSLDWNDFAERLHCRVEGNVEQGAALRPIATPQLSFTARALLH